MSKHALRFIMALENAEQQAISTKDHHENMVHAVEKLQDYQREATELLNVVKQTEDPAVVSHANKRASELLVEIGQPAPDVALESYSSQSAVIALEGLLSGIGRFFNSIHRKFKTLSMNWADQRDLEGLIKKGEDYIASSNKHLGEKKISGDVKLDVDSFKTVFVRDGQYVPNIIEAVIKDSSNLNAIGSVFVDMHRRYMDNSIALADAFIAGKQNSDKTLQDLGRLNAPLNRLNSSAFASNVFLRNKKLRTVEEQVDLPKGANPATTALLTAMSAPRIIFEDNAKKPTKTFEAYSISASDIPKLIKALKEYVNFFKNIKEDAFHMQEYIMWIIDFNSDIENAEDSKEAGWIATVLMSTIIANSESQENLVAHASGVMKALIYIIEEAIYELEDK